MLWLKTCPKCSGDLSQERDDYGPYIQCTQCGLVLNQIQEAALKAGHLAARPACAGHARKPATMVSA